MAAKVNETWIVNIYAPSGGEKKQEREHFYNTDLTQIIPLTYTDMTITGDFNCILTKTDSTGTKNYSRALTNSDRSEYDRRMGNDKNKGRQHPLHSERSFKTR
jgi:exonuclease III